MRYLSVLWLAGALICVAGAQQTAYHPNLPADQEPEGSSGAARVPLDEWEQPAEAAMNILAQTSGGMFVAAIATQAATIIVTSDSGGTGGPDCTLRDAIIAANRDTPTGGCPAGNGADTIELPGNATITLTEVDNETDGPNGLPSVTSEITIIGNGTAVQRDEAGGTPDFRIFQVAADGNLLLNGLTVRNGSAQGEFPASGGGILNRGALELTNCTISGNTAGFDDLGGGGIGNGGMLTVTHSTITGNTAGVGGGIGNNGTLTLTGSAVTGNSSNRGGGIYNTDFGTATLTNSAVNANSIDGDFGGGICNFYGTVTLTNCTVKGNSALAVGGIFNDGTMTLTNSTVSDNTANGDFGSGISNRGFLALRNSTSSGGISNRGLLDLTNCTISGNSASFGGGLSNFGIATLTNCTISSNTANGGGGGIFNSSVLLTLTNCTVSRNTAEFGGGIYNIESLAPPMLTSSIIWDNEPDQINGEAVVRYSNVPGEWPGEGNIDAEPLFIDPANGDYRLSVGSPCIDAGDNTAVPEGIVTDLDGNPRFVDDPNADDTGFGDPPIVDMGAYEFRDPCEDDDGDGRVAICHIPPGNPDNADTIAVNVNALRAHLAHGDYCGPCEAERSMGREAGRKFGAQPGSPASQLR